VDTASSDPVGLTATERANSSTGLPIAATSGPAYVSEYTARTSSNAETPATTRPSALTDGGLAGMADPGTVPNLWWPAGAAISAPAWSIAYIEKPTPNPLRLPVPITIRPSRAVAAIPVGSKELGSGAGDAGSAVSAPPGETANE
jgi:hypothetical protein